MLNYKNRTALITGAANGIGKKIALALYQRGCNIIACDIREDLLQDVYSHCDTGRVLTQQTDISKPEDWEMTVTMSIKKFSQIDFLLNIAGVIEPGYIHDTSIEKINRQVDINLKGTIYGVHFVSKKMIENKSGHIINISSMAGLAPVPGLNIYSATKFGVRGFSLAVAQELLDYNIQVSVICPDAVKTGMLDYQKDKKEAAMTFSTNKFLTVDDLEKAIFKTLEKPVMEVWLPKGRGWLATMGSIFPKLTMGIKRKMIRKGLKQQKEY